MASNIYHYKRVCKISRFSKAGQKTIIDRIRENVTDFKNIWYLYQTDSKIYFCFYDFSSKEETPKRKMLKELRNCILHTVFVLLLFYWIRAYTSLENYFFCLSALFVFTACSDFEKLFINFCNICIIPRDFEILAWCPAGPILPHGKNVPL